MESMILGTVTVDDSNTPILGARDRAQELFKNEGFEERGMSHNLIRFDNDLTVDIIPIKPVENLIPLLAPFLMPYVTY